MRCPLAYKSIALFLPYMPHYCRIILLPAIRTRTITITITFSFRQQQEHSTLYRQALLTGGGAMRTVANFVSSVGWQGTLQFVEKALYKALSLNPGFGLRYKWPIITSL
jgi:hypothetical protein